MPIVQLNIMEGRSAEQKSAAAKAITEALEKTLGAPASTVRVLIHELAPDGYYVAGQTMEERAQSRTNTPNEETSR